MWSGLKCSAGSWAASLSWTMTLQFGNESRGKHFLTPGKKNTNPTNVSHSGFVWTQFWWKVEDLVGIYEWGLARVFTGMYMCAYACVCTLLGKWACQYAAQASLWWQADDSAVIGLISLRTWGEIWRLPQGSGAYHLPAHWRAHAHMRTRSCTDSDACTYTQRCAYSYLLQTRTYRCMDRRMKPETWISAHLGDTHMYVLKCTLSLLLYYKVNYRNLLRECCTIPSVCLTTQC